MLTKNNSCTLCVPMFDFSDHNDNAIPLFVNAILPLKFVYYESIANLMFDYS